MTRPETIVYIATSVDGFIARPDDTLDWLERDTGGEDHGFQELLAGLDSILLGRRSYEVVRGFDVEWPYQDLKAFVWSRTLTDGDLPPELRELGVEVSALPPAELLDELGRRGLERIWIDGGRTIQTFLASVLIDVITVTQIPVLIGAGIRLFGALPADVHLAHQRTRSYPSGFVQSTWRVERPD